MKKLIVRSALTSFLLIAVSMVYGGAPMNVTISDASGKAAFKGKADVNGGFATGNVKPGNYVVQFSSNDPAVRGKKYTFVVSAGTKKVSANNIPGENLAKGVAMKVDVAPGMNITGQIASNEERLSKDGKKMVWIPPQLGSHMPGHWAEEGSAEAIEARTRKLIGKDPTATGGLRY